MATIAYTDPSLRWFGRWSDSGVGKRANWQGGAVAFEFIGTSLAVTVANIAPTYALERIAAWIDSDTDAPPTYTSVDLPAGVQTVTLASGLSAGSHTAYVYPRLDGYYVDLTRGTRYLEIRSFTCDSVSAVAAHPSLLVMGDSLTGGIETFWKHMGGYDCHAVAVGGQKLTVDVYDAAEVNSVPAGYNAYLYKTVPNYPSYSGAIAHGDPAFDAAVVLYGVNDSGAGVTTAAFKSAAETLVNRIVAYQGEIPVFLVQAPNTVNADGHLYGTVLSEIATARGYCHYVETASIQSQMTFSDGTHPDTNGCAVLGGHVKTAIAAVLGAIDFDLSLPLAPVVDAIDFDLMLPQAYVNAALDFDLEMPLAISSQYAPTQVIVVAEVDRHITVGDVPTTLSVGEPPERRLEVDV